MYGMLSIIILMISSLFQWTHFIPIGFSHGNIPFFLFISETISVTMVGISARAFRGAVAPKKIKKRAFLGKKLTQFGQKLITLMLFVHNVFFWMIIRIMPDMNIIEVSSLI